MHEMEFELFAKFFLNGIISGSLYALIALGLSLLYGVLRFVNLAYGEYALVGAYAFFSFHYIFEWPFLPSVLAGFMTLLIIVFIIQKTTFDPVRDAPSLIPLVISIAVSIFLKNLLLMIFQARSRLLAADTISIPLFSDIVTITNIQLIIVIVSTILMIGLTIFLKQTQLGKAIRAVSDNREVAAILGININKIITATFLISGLLAGIAGILAAYDQNLHPHLGTLFTVKAFAAVILGSIGSIPGAVIGGYIIGIAENIFIAIPFGDFTIPSNYKDVVAYAILLLLLYIKPTGLFGRKKEEMVRKS